jgi:hypothetical protein
MPGVLVPDPRTRLASVTATAATLSRSAGLRAVAATRSFASSGLSAAEYVELSVTGVPRCRTGLWLYIRVMSGSDAPTALEFRTSIDSFASVAATVSTPRTATLLSVAMPAVGPLPSTVSIRIYGGGVIAGAGARDVAISNAGFAAVIESAPVDCGAYPLGEQVGVTAYVHRVEDVILGSSISDNEYIFCSGEVVTTPLAAVKVDCRACYIVPDLSAPPPPPPPPPPV